MPEIVFEVDQSKSMAATVGAGAQPVAPGHPSGRVGEAGSEFRIECRDWTDCQIGNNDPPTTSATSTCTPHMLSGPIGVEGAEPGDLLVVDILDLGRAAGDGDAGQGWGYTGIFAKANGGGFLTDYFPDAYKAIWDFHGQHASPATSPGSASRASPIPASSGTAPSHELLARVEPP